MENDNGFPTMDDHSQSILALFKKYKARFYCQALQIVKVREQAEDIVTDSFVKLWRRRYEFKTGRDMESYLCVIIKNMSIDYIRHVQVKTNAHREMLYACEYKTDCILSMIFRKEMLQFILQEVEKLPPMRKKIFKMVFLEGMSVLEIAIRLNITQDTVRVQKANAIQAIRRAILERYPNQGSRA